MAAPPFSFLETLNKVEECIDANADIADAIVQRGLDSLGLSDSASSASSTTTPEWHNTATKLDLDKARSTLHQLYRDWSAEGVAERTACFGPVLLALHQRFGHPPSNPSSVRKSPPRILVPGAGLGRLVFELALAGYEAHGNELSYHALLASSFMLNSTSRAKQFNLYPFATTFSNHHTRAAQLRAVEIPDMHPGSHVPFKGSMSMTTGDFVAVYGEGAEEDEHKGSFDAVTTVFFVDTAPNLMTYIETVKHCLRTGGYWINIGPLLWHFDSGKSGGASPEQEQEESLEAVQDEPHTHPSGTDHASSHHSHKHRQPKTPRIGTTGGSVQLTEDEVIKLVEMAGFTMELHETGRLATGYVQDPESMLQNIYKPVFWVARKL